VLKNVTVTLDDEDLKWARMKAAEEDTSVSRLLGEMIRRERLGSDSYQAAYRRWKRLKPLDVYASRRMSREEAHERR
jgi:hypothetical protein